MSAPGARPVRVLMPCTGLGRVRRGYEVFTRSCAGALRGRDDVAVTVYAGGGDLEAGERATWNLPRRGGAARAIGALVQRDPYFVEQLSFAVGMLPRLAANPPDVVYFADLNLGNALWWLRRAVPMRYRLLYYNGGPTTRPFTRCDVVQQVSPEHLAASVARGESRDRQFLLPHGVDIPKAFAPPTAAVRDAARDALGVPRAGQVILSVGALSLSHKRMDAVVDAVAALPSQPFLLLVGEETDETPRLRAHARDRLGERCAMRTLPPGEMPRAYAAADAFVLASFREGFGLAQVEAMAAGLPCVAHDSATSRYVLGLGGFFGDLAVADALPNLLRAALDAGMHDAGARHDAVWRRFSWDVLRDAYAAALVDVAAGRCPRDHEAAP